MIIIIICKFFTNYTYFTNDTQGWLPEMSLSQTLHEASHDNCVLAQDI